MYGAKVIEKRVVSFWMNSSPNSSVDGELTFGGVNDKRRTGPVNTFPVLANQSRWTVNVTKVAVGKELLCKNSCSGVISSNAYGIVVSPPSEADRINQVLGTKKTQFPYRQFDCAKAGQMPKVSFVMLNRNNEPVQYEMSADDYMLTYKGGCYSPFVGVSVSPQVPANTWIIGIVFMNTFHVTLDADQKAVELAKSVVTQ